MSYLYLNNSTKFWFYSENQTVCTPWWYSGTLLVKLVFKGKKKGLNPRKNLLVFTSCKSPVANAYQIIIGSYYRLLCKTKLLDFCFQIHVYSTWLRWRSCLFESFMHILKVRCTISFHRLFLTVNTPIISKTF